MKLAKRARGVLKGLRSKQSASRREKSSKSSQPRYNVVLSLPEQDPCGEPPQREAARFSRKAPTQPRAVAATGGKGESARIPGTRPSHNMGHPTIAIHEDDDLSVDDTLQSETMREEEEAQFHSAEEDSGDDSTSEASEESEEEADESVIEDMRRLEANFKGISRKYRLINRIGEG